MKLVDANYILMIGKRRHLEFVASRIIHKEKIVLRKFIIKISKNREMNLGWRNEYVTSTYTIDGVDIEMTIIYNDSRNSEEDMFYFGIGSKPPYPIRCWNNCLGQSILEHIQEYIDNVIIRKKIII